jgi:stearoyl-CoA desaturase (delta-9 desaturase)
MQATAHIALVALIVMGRWDLLLLSLLVYCLTGCVGMTVTYHRLLSHRSFKAPKWFERMGTLCGAYGLTGSSIAWVAVHREHHRHSDRPGDPHSPHVIPWWKVQWWSMFEPVNPRFAVDLSRDSFHRVIHRWYLAVHLGFMVVGLATFPLATMALYLAPAAILWNAGSAINTLNHLVGSRPSATKDHSTNHWLTGWLVFGEGWHNHHHAHPSDPRFGQRWWEVDVGWWVIRAVRTD